MLRLHDTIVSPREYYLVSAFRSSPVDCSGSTFFFLHVGGSNYCLVAAMSCADFRGRIDGAKRQSMTSVGEMTAEEGRGIKCC
jgi:hypothetical protein